MPEQVEEARVGTQRPHALWEHSASLITSLHVSVSWCLCSLYVCVCVSACLPLAHVDELTPWCKEGTHWIRF